MTISEVVARWNSLTPAERDAWVAEKCMDLQVGWLRYWGMAGRDGLQWYDGSLHRGEWSPDPWPDTPALGPDEMLMHFGTPHFERRVRWQSRGYREAGEDARCHSLPPLTQDNNAALEVAEKLGLGVIPVHKTDEDGLEGPVVAWVASPCGVTREAMPYGRAYLDGSSVDADLIQPTPAAAICLAGLAYVEGEETR